MSLRASFITPYYRKQSIGSRWRYRSLSVPKLAARNIGWKTATPRRCKGVDCSQYYYRPGIFDVAGPQFEIVERKGFLDGRL